MGTIDGNGIYFYEETDSLSPLHTLLNVGQQSVSDALGTWAAYTPTWTNLSPGNATVTARWTKSGDTVRVAVTFVWGSSTSITAANVYMGLPVSPTNSGSDTLLGSVGLRDASGAWRVGGAFRSGSTVRLIMSDGTNLTSAVPWTWAVGDIISVNLSYEVA